MVMLMMNTLLFGYGFLGVFCQVSHMVNSDVDLLALQSQFNPSPNGSKMGIETNFQSLELNSRNNTWKPYGDSNNGHCVWYDIDKNNKYNIFYDGEGKMLEDETSVTKLGEVCPELFVDLRKRADEAGEERIRTCCSPRQIEKMTSDIGMAAAMVNRCPSCFRNMRLNWCYMACDPAQSNYLVPGELIPPSNETDNNTLIKDLDLYVSDAYAVGMYDSCKDVTNPNTNSKAIYLMCMPWSSLCNPYRLLSSFGLSSDNPVTPGFAPFEIHYHFVKDESDRPENIIEFNPELIPCNQAITEEASACSCVDCEASCPVPPPLPPIPLPWKVGRLDGYAFILIIISASFCTTFLVISYYSLITRQRVVNEPHAVLHHTVSSSSSVTTDDDITFREKLGANLEKFFETVFSSWGEVCARYAIFVLIIGVALSVALSCCVVYVKVTIDPVELWAAPESRSRVEKDYFDSNFAPFFRTEQVIIAAKNLEPFEYV